MKSRAMLSLIFFYVCYVGSTNAANRYQAEIDIIKQNQAIYSEMAENKLKVIDDVVNVWKKMSDQMSEIKRIISLKVKTKSENLAASAKQLQAFSDEKIYVENVLLAITTIAPKIELLEKELEHHLNKLPEIKEDNMLDFASLFGDFKNLERDFKNRKMKVDENLEVFRLWQFEIASEAVVTYKYAVMENLEVLKSLGQINNTLSLLSLKFSLVMRRKKYSEAEKILNSYSWLKSVFPFYFSDKITTQSQYDLLNQMISDSEYEQHEMIESLGNRLKIRGE